MESPWLEADASSPCSTWYGSWHVLTDDTCLPNGRVTKAITPSLSKRETLRFLSHPWLWTFSSKVLMDLEAPSVPGTGNQMLWSAEEKQVLNSAWYSEQTRITFVIMFLKSHQLTAMCLICMCVYNHVCSYWECIKHLLIKCSNIWEPQTWTSGPLFWWGDQVFRVLALSRV